MNDALLKRLSEEEKLTWEILCLVKHYSDCEVLIGEQIEHLEALAREFDVDLTDVIEEVYRILETAIKIHDRIESWHVPPEARKYYENYWRIVGHFDAAGMHQKDITSRYVGKDVTTQKAEQLKDLKLFTHLVREIRRRFESLLLFEVPNRIRQRKHEAQSATP